MGDIIKFKSKDSGYIASALSIDHITSPNPFVIIIKQNEDKQINLSMNIASFDEFIETLKELRVIYNDKINSHVQNI